MTNASSSGKGEDDYLLSIFSRNIIVSVISDRFERNHDVL